MHHFTYRDKEMYCEEVPLHRIADEVGTPFYLYSHATLERHFKAFDGAFQDMERLVCFSAKANTNLAVLSLFAGLGSGLDIVSGGELFRGLKAGFPPERIVNSLEMRMKCGIGKCGRCNIGPKYVCKDGPVFTLAQLKEMPNEY